MIPINNRFIVKKVEEKEKFGVIEVPETVDPRVAIAYGKIEATPKVMLNLDGSERECSLKVGDKVVFNIWCQQVRMNNEEIWYLPTENEIIAVIE